MTDEHDAERFLVVRAIFLASWAERFESIAFSSVEGWTGFERVKVERIVGSLIDSKHAIRVADEEDEEAVTLQLTKRGREWPTRR